MDEQKALELGPNREFCDGDLEKTVDTNFLGQTSLREVLFAIIEHGSLHIGQAWGILKGKGVAS